MNHHRISSFIGRLGCFSLILFMAAVGAMIYAAATPLHEVGHVLIGMSFGQHLGSVEWFNATAWMQGAVFGKSVALGWLVMLPQMDDPALTFDQLTLFHGAWNVGLFLSVAYVESRIVKVWSDNRR